MKILRVLAIIMIGVVAAGATQIPSDSIYQFQESWKTQEGKEMKLEELRGQNVALAFFYSTCRSVCPMIIDTMGIAKKTVTQSTKPPHFVLVSLDPEVDTEAALKAFAEKRQLPNESWHLLRGTPEQVRRLSVIMQAKYAPAEEGQFTHSNFITALDNEGRVLGSVPGIPTNAARLAELLNKKSKD